jgi:large subunit ribosomal protein L22
MSTDEPDKTEETEPAAEETEAAAAAAAGAGADAPEADTPEPSAEEAPAPKPRRRRRKAAEPAAEEPPAPAPAAEASEEPPADPDLLAAQEAEDEAEAEAAGEEPEAEEAPVAAPPVAPQPAVDEEEPEPAKPSRPAPSRRRARRDPDLPAPVVRAQARYVRSSARKARLVCDHIRGKSVEEARAILALTPRAIARDWSKLLESAVANAEHNHELVGEDLYVTAVHADEGPTIKRFRPRAMGRATRIRKRTSHLTILLTPKD